MTTQNSTINAETAKLVAALLGSVSAPAPVNDKLSLMVWNEQTQIALSKSIQTGAGIRDYATSVGLTTKEVTQWVKTQPGGSKWLATERTTRKDWCITNTARILGELQNQDFKATKLSMVKEMKNGNRVRTMTFTQFAETAEAKLRKELDAARAELAAIRAAAKK